MNDKDWRILLALREEKSISKAATKLFLSQPALTYHVDQLEKEMETQLFIRSSKGIQFTSAGERLASYADEMLQKYADIKKSLIARPGNISGILRLGSSAVFAHSKLPHLLKEFNQKYPNIEITLFTGLSNSILDKLQRGLISIAIIRGNHPWTSEDIMLYKEKLCLFSTEKIPLQNLANVPGIFYTTDPTIQYQIDKWWTENYSKPPKILMHADSVFTCVQLVLAGLGWAIVPESRLPKNKKNLCVLPIKDKNNKFCMRATRLIYNASEKNIDSSRVFINFIIEHFKKSIN